MLVDCGESRPVAKGSRGKKFSNKGDSLALCLVGFQDMVQKPGFELPVILVFTALYEFLRIF